MRLAFATLILEEYRKFIIEGSKIKGIDMNQLEKIFKDASDSTIEYLQYKYQAAKNYLADVRLGD